MIKRVMQHTLRLLFVWSKKLHRLMMWVAILLSGFMGATGLLLKSSLEGERLWLISWFDLSLVRQLHGSVGSWLTLTLVVMIATGLVLWGYPLFIRRKQ